MATTQMNVRLEDDLKRRGDAAFAAAGYTPTQVVRRIWERAAETGGDPEALVALVNGSGVGEARDRALLEESSMTLRAVDALLEEGRGGELEDFQDRFIDELSGGQRQRAMIAMVIAQDTEYVLLDEPTNNLDIYHATNMMKIVRRLCDELGKTVILVLHEINYAAFYSDYICAFKDGKIARFGTVEEVMTKENLSQIYGVDFEILTIAGKPLSIYY